MILLEKLNLRKIHRISSGIDFSKRNKLNIGRVLVKLLGLYGTVGLAVFFYWIFPEYHSGFYDNYLRLAKILLPVILIGSIPYFFILDLFMCEPCDNYWHAGKLFLFQWKNINKTVLKHHLLGWLVKVFFLALMFTFLYNNTGFLLNSNLPDPKSDFSVFFNYTNTLLYTIDLLFVSAGYLLTLKIFDSHIRTTEPTFFGWMIALICYQPFWGQISSAYISYEDGYNWSNFYSNDYLLYQVWGSVILFLVTIYVMATIVFGVRFSNLTNRGIITNGPYRLMKHPAYISKNLSWWLISLPFISNEGVNMAIKHTLLLILLNIVYYLRAKTEERHLSLDPVYVQYATAMNNKGIFRWLYKIAPFLKYNENKYKENGKLKSLFLYL